MSSGEEWSPSAEEPCARRRSTRLSRQAEKPKPSEETPEKRPRTFGKKSTTTPAKKKKSSSKVKKETSRNSIDSLLTKEELKILFEKWERDRHFRADSPPKTDATIVVSRTSDGKSVTTKISCNNRNNDKYFLRELASSLTGTSAIAAGSSFDTDASVSFSTPIIDPLEIPPAEDKKTKTTSCTETSPKTPTLVHSTSGPEIFNHSEKILSDQIPQIASSGFVTPRRFVQSQTAREDPSFFRPNLNPWNLSAAPNSTMGIESRAFDSGTFLSGSNNLQNRYASGLQNRFSNSNANLQMRDDCYNLANLNVQNSFPLQNQHNAGNMFNNWNSMFQYSSPSLPSWNGEQLWGNNYWTGGNAYNNMYGNQNAAGFQQFNKENFPVNSNVGNENSAIFSNIPESCNNYLPEIKNIENDLALLDDKRPSFGENESSSSYEDDIEYEDCIENLENTNENAVSTTLIDGILPSYFIKSEMIDHSSGETGRFRYNNDSLPEMIRQSSVLLNFDGQKDGTPECIVVD